MITIIPSLDFVRGLCGYYKAEGGKPELRVWACGYGVALDLRGKKKTELVGVVGAFNDSIECYAQIGLPNVIRFVGNKTSETSIHFSSAELPFEWHVSREVETLRITIVLQGMEKVAYVLHAA